MIYKSTVKTRRCSTVENRTNEKVDEWSCEYQNKARLDVQWGDHKFISSSFDPRQQNHLHQKSNSIKLQ